MDQYYREAEIVIQCSAFVREDEEVTLEALRLSESGDEDSAESEEAAESEDILDAGEAPQSGEVPESKDERLVSEGEWTDSEDAAGSDDADDPEEAPRSDASASQVVSRPDFAPKPRDGPEPEGGAMVVFDSDPDRPPLDPGNEELVFRFPYVSKEGKIDEIFVQLADDIKWYRESEEHAASRGWILQEQMLCRRLLTFPSTGGMIFRCDESPDFLLGGNVIYDTDSRTSSSWGKETLMTEDQAEQMDIQRFHGRLKAKIDTIRHLAMSGSSPALFLMPFARIIELNHDPTLRGPPSENTCKIMQARVRMPQYRRLLVPRSDQNAPALPVGTPMDQQNLTEMTITTKCDPNTAVLGPTMVFEWHDRYRLINIEPPHGAIMAEDVDRAWKSIVTDYGHRQLSYPADKLIAIAALAKEYASRYGACLGDYKAGMWADFLALSLTWKVLNTSRTHSPSGSKRAPSWSWAAVEGASYHDLHFSEDDGEPDYLDPEIEILECETVLHKESLPFGAVTEGFLKLRGKVQDVKWGPRHDETRDSRFTVYDLDSGETLCERACAAYPDHLDCQPGDVPEPVTLLLAQRSVQGVGHEDDHYVDALLLKVSGDGNDYVRVGYMYCCMEEYEKVWSGRFRDEVITIR
ncbi:MAG: hypothetical protein OHK93_003597 [Ramalina farinacea]|uniref:Uncharacterized protein n=1 Tax=Ramalina farinacea TaxID=258253 RepID=A0AA43QWT7_9LECA|nr:hypothetical protein [Ramalina farinacea]